MESTQTTGVAARRGGFRETVREPVIANMLRHRVVSGVLAVVGMAQVATAARHITVVACPMAWMFGIPCPGCGLTRGTVYLTAGRFREAMVQHAFSPVVVVGIVMLAVAAVGPRRVRAGLCDGRAPAASKVLTRL